VCVKCGEQVLRWQVLRRIEEVTRARTTLQPTERIDVPVFAY
jgi:hypothetical protein